MSYDNMTADHLIQHMNGYHKCKVHQYHAMQIPRSNRRLL